MRAIWAIALVSGSTWLLGSGLAQDKGEAPPPTADKPTEKSLGPAEERSDLTPAQLRDLAATLKINEILNHETKIDVVETPLIDVLRNISKVHKLPIVLDPEGCESAGVEPNHLITMEVKDISLRNALRTLLKPLRLSFAVRHEVLTITALDCPERLATVRTFPLGNLVERMDDPSELISTLEIIWPDDEDRIGEEKSCQPRARILANHLVVRGSPRHLDLAEQLIDGLMAERPAPEVKATLPLPDAFRSLIPPASKGPVPTRKPRPVEPAPPKPVQPEPEAR